MGANESTQTERWTVRRLLAWMSEFFAAKGIAKGRVDAEHLLAHVLGAERLQLYMDPEREPDPPELKQLRELVKRRARREPLQHLIGSVQFLNVEIAAGPGAFIPRPETEVVAREAIRLLGSEPATAVDLCTGTACIACALAHDVPQVRVFATDQSSDALAWAQRNIEALELQERVTLLEGNLAEPLQGTVPDNSCDLVVCNPPYVGEREKPELSPEVLQDPPQALFAGEEGLDLYPRILEAASKLLRPGGWLVLEIGATQRAAIEEMIQQTTAFEVPEALQDLTGRDRVLRTRHQP